MKQVNYCLLVVKILNRLNKAHPTYNIGKHISTAIDDSDIWGVSDKELFLALQKYELELNMDVNHVDEEIDDIIKDGLNLNNILSIDDEEYQ